MIAIIGSDGQLGQDLLKTLAPREARPVSHSELDITDRDRTLRVVEKMKPDWIINAAAMTNVDLCETENTRAFEINALGARHLAEASRDTGARLIQIGTDYVFDGMKDGPYIETDMPHPINAYGITKLAGELYTTYLNKNHYLVRTSGLYGLHPCRGKGGKNFIDTMLGAAGKNDSLRIVADEVLTPTFTGDLAAQIDKMIEAEPPFGTYHATNSGQCSWFEFAEVIFKKSRVKITLKKTTAAEWGAPARRPAYSVLANTALLAQGIDIMPAWEDALGRYLAKKLDS